MGKSRGNQPEAITDLLSRYNSGDALAFAGVYSQLRLKLRQLASGYLSRERAGHTLQPTDLIHEALASVLGQSKQWKNRNHFVAVAALSMRQVLATHARRKRTQKRKGIHLSLESVPQLASAKNIDLTLMDDLLTVLARENSRQCRVVELRFFGGMNTQEISEVLGISPRTVEREWQAARVWLFGQLIEKKEQAA